MKNLTAYTAAMGLACSIVMTTGAQAATIDESGAAKLKQLLENSGYWQVMNQPQTADLVNLEGDITVKPSGSYYAVTMPRMTMPTQDGGAFDFGSVTMNAVPADNGRWKISMLMPSPMTMTGPDGEALFEVVIGAQKSGGVWIPAEDIYPQYDASFRDIMIRPLTDAGQDNIEARIGSFRTTMNMKQEADGTWTGPNSMAVQNVRIGVGGADGFQVSVDDFNVNSFYDSAKMKGSEELMKSIENVGANPEAAGVDALLALSSNMFDSFKNVANGLKTEVSVNNLAVRSTGDGETGAEPIAFKMDKAGAMFSLQGIKEAAANGKIRVNVDNMHFTGGPTSLSQVTPNNVEVDIDAEGLPLQAIIDMMASQTERALTAGTDPGEMPGMMGIAGLMSIPEIMSRAGTRIAVNKFDYFTPTVKGRMTGELLANAMAAMGMTAEFNLLVTGLQEAIDAVSQSGPEGQGTSSMMMMMQQMGQPVDNGGRSFKLQLTADGALMLNGQPYFNLNMLNQGGGPGMMPPPHGGPGMRDPGYPPPQKQ